MLRKYSRVVGRGIELARDYGKHSALEDLAINYLNYLPATFAFLTHGNSNRPKHPGVADIIVCRKGRLIAIEIKVRKDKQSPEQEDFEAYIDNAGGSYYIVHNLDELQLLMKGLR